MADRLTLGEVIGVVHPIRCGGELPSKATIGPVTTDSREVGAGSLFIALPGERADGADFVEDAFRAGALAAIVSEEGEKRIPRTVSAANPVLVVRNPVEALGELARAHRERHRKIPIVGITGSSGKTTTKDMLAGLLSRVRNVHRNPGNRNNLIGMPLALLTLSAEHDVAILEMGTNQPGEIARLAAIASPDVGIITNIGPAHLKGLGSLEGVAREKGELFRALPESGTAVVNATDLRVVREAGRCRAGKIFFGLPLNDVSGRVLSISDKGMRIAVRTPTGGFTSEVAVPGEHILLNALAAAAAAFALGIRPAEMEDGFRSFVSGQGRFRPVPTRDGGLLLDDTYNANPASVEAAVRNLEALQRGRRSVVILGDMLELGEASSSAHFRIGHLLASGRVDLLITHGQEAESIARGALEGGMDPARVTHVGDRGLLAETVSKALLPGDIILIKGSRGMRLEEIAGIIEKEWA